MFAYCANNPVINIDISGTRHVKGIDSSGESSRYYGAESDINEYADYTLFSKKYTNRRDSGMNDLSDDEIMRRARDRSLSGKERRKYQEEEKVRGLRNRQKRNQFSLIPNYSKVIICGSIIIASLGIAYVVLNDVTIIGTADDPLLIPLVAWVANGTKMLFA